eukprot:SAG11_NODE_835_length_6927_cov_2.877142_5_plen_92_part_00
MRFSDTEFVAGLMQGCVVVLQWLIASTFVRATRYLTSAVCAVGREFDLGTVTALEMSTTVVTRPSVAVVLWKTSVASATAQVLIYTVLVSV